MNAKPKSFNAFTAAVLTASVSIGALAYNFKPFQPAPSSDFNVQIVDSGVQSLKLTSETTGVAVIKIDEYRLYVNFDFEAHPDSYGVPGSDFTAVDITNLEIEKVLDKNGNAFQDFTDDNDIRNINLLIATFIERNNLVGAA